MNRRHFLSRSLIGGATTLLSPWRALPMMRRGEEIAVERAVFVMGTVVRITINAGTEREALAAGSKAFSEIHRLDRLLSIYRPESDISRINRAAGDHAPVVHQEVLNLLERAADLSSASGGALDITIEPLMRLWGFRNHHRQHTPTDAEVARALDRVGLKHLVLDRKAQTAGLTTRGACLDLGGIGVGYAVDRAVEILRRWGIERAFINHSGDAFALGAPPDADGWDVIVPHPTESGESVARMQLRDRAISTSGNSRNFIVLEGIRRGHILDPRTGTQSNGFLGVTVTAPSSLTADALSTGFFCLQQEELKALIQQTADIEATCVSGRSEEIEIFRMRSPAS